MKKFLLVAVLTACSITLADGRDLTVDEIRLVQAGVREHLKDPDSARFKDILSATDSKNTETVCGLVNAKNSFGGYTGFVPFYGLLMTGKRKTDGKIVPFHFAALAIGDDSTMTSFAIDKCGEAGIAIM